MKISDNIEIDYGYDSYNSSSKIAFDNIKIIIRKKVFPVIDKSELYRSRNEVDGYYRFIYIQINFKTGEYYIGKANRPTWGQALRYIGSGRVFKSKYKKHKDEFVRFVIAVCQSAEETEKLEASIVTEELLQDPLCLNLIVGGGGISGGSSEIERTRKISAHIKQHPEQYAKMREVANREFCSGNKTDKLKARSDRIKQVMSDEKYKLMSSERIKNWRKNNPDAYKSSRENLSLSRKTPESRLKSRNSRLHWIENHPEEHKMYEKNRIEACLKRRKQIYMINPDTLEIINCFDGLKVAGMWLIQNNKTTSTRCYTFISAICSEIHKLKKFTKKKAYGYMWCFKEDKYLLG